MNQSINTSVKAVRSGIPAVESNESAQADNRMPTTPERIVAQCSVTLFSDLWDDDRFAIRLTCAEMTSRRLVRNPQIRSSSQCMLEGLDQAIAKSPVVFATNPMGHSVYLDLRELRKDMAEFDGTAPVIRAGADKPTRVPVAQIPMPYAYRLMPDGKFVFLESKKTPKRLITGSHSREVEATFAIISPLFPQLRRAQDFQRLLNQQDTPLATLRMYSRIASAYRSFTRTHQLSEEASFEALALMAIAPAIDPEIHLATEEPRFLRKELALAAMKAVHAEPGEPLNAFYYAFVRL